MSEDYTAVKLPRKILNNVKSWQLLDWWKVHSDTLSLDLAIDDFDSKIKALDKNLRQNKRSSSEKIDTFNIRLIKKLNHWVDQQIIDPNSRGFPRK